jgi:hypothetical protein
MALPLRTALQRILLDLPLTVQNTIAIQSKYMRDLVYGLYAKSAVTDFAYELNTWFEHGPLNSSGC